MQVALIGCERFRPESAGPDRGHEEVLLSGKARRFKERKLYISSLCSNRFDGSLVPFSSSEQSPVNSRVLLVKPLALGKLVLAYQLAYPPLWEHPTPDDSLALPLSGWARATRPERDKARWEIRRLTA